MKKIPLLTSTALLVAILSLDAMVARAQGPGNAEQQNRTTPADEAAVAGQAANALKSSLEPKERASAAHFLGQMGPEGAPAVLVLVGALEDSSPAVRIESVMALERIGPAARAAVPALIAILNGHDATLNHQGLILERAVDALGAIGHDAAKAVPVLVRYLKSGDQSRSSSAGLALARILPRDHEILHEAVPILVPALKRKQPSIRGDASRALALIGPAALPPLIALIESPATDPELAWNAEVAIEGMGAEAVAAVPALVKAFQSEDPNVVAEAARALGAIGPQAEESIPELRKLLQHPDSNVRAHAASALGDLGPPAIVAIEDLLKVVHDPDEHVRREAVEAVGRMGPSARSAVPALIEVLDDPAAEVTVHAALALTRIGRDAVPRLAQLVSENEKLRSLAVLILRQLGEDAETAVGTLTKALSSDNPYFVREVILTLAEIGPKAKSAAPALAKLLTGETPELRGPAAYALAHLGVRDTVPVLAGILKQQQDPQLRHLAASGLVLLEPNNNARAVALIPLLTDGLGDRSSIVRHEAATALRFIGPQSAPAVPSLIQGLNDPQATLRVDFLWTLASIGPDAAPALPQIIRAMNRDEFVVRYAACYAAGSIGKTATGAIPILMQNLESRDEFLQFVSAWAFVHIVPPEEAVVTRCLPPLMKGLKLSDPRARREAALAIALLGSAGHDAVPALRDAARDDDNSVRQAVAQALAKIEK